MVIDNGHTNDHFPTSLFAFLKQYQGGAVSGLSVSRLTLDILEAATSQNTADMPDERDVGMPRFSLVDC
jgi:hypothetical protein